MFISKTHLPQILRPEDYTSVEQFDRELEVLFRPGWHCVGTLADLPNEGDFLTFRLFDTPLIVWRTDGTVQAFLNVCPHRFSALTDQRCGHAGDRLRCRYHGWEFDGTGNTRKIPDAKNFKPLEQGMLGLQSFRTATCGQLIYVSLAADGPDLPEWLGPGYDLGCEIFGSGYRHFYTLEQEIGANWKIKLENALESYHVGIVHKDTFGKMPDEDLCEHEIHDSWTRFTSREPATSRVDRFLDRLVHRLARVEQTWAYSHYVFYPYVLFTHGGLLSAVEVLYPMAPNRTRGVVHYFCNPGPAGTLRSKLLYKGLSSWGKKFFTKVAREDTDLMPGIQQGMETGLQPSEGLISIREERLFHFQNYIRRATQAYRLTPDDSTGRGIDHLAETEMADVCGGASRR